MRDGLTGRVIDEIRKNYVTEAMCYHARQKRKKKKTALNVPLSVAAGPSARPAFCSML